MKKIISVATALMLVGPMTMAFNSAFAETQKIPVDFTKEDADSGEPIEGATITIKKLKGTHGNTGTVIFTGKTNAEGKILKDEKNKDFFNENDQLVLDSGSQYEFLETNAPKGYILNQRAIVQNLDINTFGSEVRLKNTKETNINNYLRINTKAGKFAEFDITLYKMKNAKEEDPKNGVKVFSGKTSAYDGKLAEDASYDAGGYLLNGDLNLTDNYYILVEGKTNRAYRINFSNRKYAEITLLDGSSTTTNSTSNGNGSSSSTGSSSTTDSKKDNKSSKKDNSGSSSKLAKTGIVPMTPYFALAGGFIGAGSLVLLKKKK